MRSASQLRRKRERGSALVLAIVVSVVITGLVITLSWACGVQAEMAANLMKVDQAFYCAESGVQRAAWYCKHSKLSGVTGATLTGSVNGYSYTTTWVTSGSSYALTSTGSLGSVASYTCYETVTPPASAAPPLASGGGANLGGGSLTVVGNVQAVNDINSANGLTVTGTISSASNINGTPAAGKPIAHATGITSPSSIITAAYTAESGAATAAGTMTNPVSVSVINFTTASNGIIYINGDGNMGGNVTVIGSGTLVVSGNINLSGSFPTVGTANANIVVKGDLNIKPGGSLNVTGSVYVGGNWNNAGTTNVTGVMAVTGDSNVHGTGTLTYSMPPSFDSRAGGSVTTLAGFEGPLP